MSTRMRDLLDQALGQLRYEPTENGAGEARRRDRRRQHAGAARLGAAPRRSDLRRPGRGHRRRADARHRDRRRRGRAPPPGHPVHGPQRRGRAGLDRRPSGAGFRFADAALAGYVALDFSAFDAVVRGGRARSSATRATRSRASTSAAPRGRSGSSSTARCSPRPPARGCCSRRSSRRASTSPARTCASRCARATCTRTARTRARRPTGRSSGAREPRLELREPAAGRRRDHRARRLLGRARRCLRRRRAPSAPGRRGLRSDAGRVRRLVPARFAVERRLDAAGLEAVTRVGLVGEQPLEHRERVRVQPLRHVGADDRERLVRASAPAGTGART